MAVTGALSLGSCSKHDDAAARISYEVKAVNKLVLSQMTISKMASVSDIDFSKAKGLKQSAAAALDAVKIGDRKAAYSYDTYMRAYIDLSTFSDNDVKDDESAKTRGQRYFEDLASSYGYKATVNFKAPLTHVTLSAVWLLRGRWISTLRNFSSTNRGILSPWHFLPRL